MSAPLKTRHLAIIGPLLDRAACTLVEPETASNEGKPKKSQNDPLKGLNAALAGTSLGDLGPPGMSNPEIIKHPTNYHFADFILEPGRAALLRAGEEIKLRPKVFDALRYLLENRGRVVPKEELIENLWPEAFVTDDSLVQCMVELRRALDDRAQEILKTVPRRGYIFAAPVTIHTDEQPSTSATADQPPRSVHGDHRLPVARTPLVGRERELEAVEQLLRDSAVRLVTLTGAGGSGKTRLGLELCRQLLPLFQSHVFFVALGSNGDPAMVPAAIAESLGI